MAEVRAAWPRDCRAARSTPIYFRITRCSSASALTGVIDFYFACTDFLAYDLAVCLNAWCFERSANTISEGRAMIGGYESVRPLRPGETRRAPVLARGAALRFFATRLADWARRPPARWCAEGSAGVRRQARASTASARSGQRLWRMSDVCAQPRARARTPRVARGADCGAAILASLLMTIIAVACRQACDVRSRARHGAADVALLGAWCRLFCSRVRLCRGMRSRSGAMAQRTGYIVRRPAARRWARSSCLLAAALRSRSSSPLADDLGRC